MAERDDARQARLAKTRDAAWTMLDDMQHMRELLAKPQPTDGDIRRMSNQIRRLLIDNGGDLARIAAPRLQRKLMLQVPDFKQEAKSTNENDTYFVTLGGGGIFGSNLERFEIAKPEISISGTESATLMGNRPDLSQPTLLLSVGLDGFLSQPVVFLDGRWFKRSEVLKYVANEAGGVHSGSHSDDDVVMLRKVRTFGAFYRHENSLALHMNVDAALRGIEGLDVVRHGVDFILVQVFSAAKYLLGSSDIKELEHIVRGEFVDPHPASP